MDKNQILKECGCINKSKDFVIMGDDLDAALSTILYLYYNPNSKVIGIYKNYSELYFSKKYFENIYELINSDNVIWIDLDINYQKACSLGHHIIRYNSFDKLMGFTNSCNLNELLNRYIRNNFTKKYPLGTIHFLLWFYDVNVEHESIENLLIWLADSSFINSQSHRFRNNVSEWLQNVFPNKSLLYTFEKLVDTLDFEKRIKFIQQEMLKFGLKQGRGQVKSKYLKLTGFQGQPDIIPKDIELLLKFIINNTSWEINLKQIELTKLKNIKGIRNKMNINDMLNKYGNLDNFLYRKNIFSYVFPYKDNINYTIFKVR